MSVDIFKGFPDEESIVNYTLNQAYQDNVTVFASELVPLGRVPNSCSSASPPPPALASRLSITALLSALPAPVPPFLLQPCPTLVPLLPGPALRLPYLFPAPPLTP